MRENEGGKEIRREILLPFHSFFDAVFGTKIHRKQIQKKIGDALTQQHIQRTSKQQENEKKENKRKQSE